MGISHLYLGVGEEKHMKASRINVYGLLISPNCWQDHVCRQLILTSPCSTTFFQTLIVYSLWCTVYDECYLPTGGVDGGWVGVCACGILEEYCSSPPVALGITDPPPRKLPSCPFPYTGCCTYQQYIHAKIKISLSETRKGYTKVHVSLYWVHVNCWEVQ